jgi:hypothetical protein
MKRAARRWATAALAGACLVSIQGRADAFPAFAKLTDGGRCPTCHFSPAGGGLPNDWGRDVAGSELALAGDGGFLHGAVTMPDWLAIGGDLRGALLVSDRGTEAEDGVAFSAFPMQIDLRGRVAWKGFSFNGTVGLRGARTTGEFEGEGGAGALAWFVSREHYLEWADTTKGIWVRAGRFYPVHGLRLPDHTLYVRRYTGLNTLEEPYGVGLSVLQPKWEVHATAYWRSPWSVPVRESAALCTARSTFPSWTSG